MRSRCTDRADTKSASLTGSVRDANISRRRADSEVSGCSRKYLGISHTATATSLLSILRNLPVARSRPVVAAHECLITGRPASPPAAAEIGLPPIDTCVRYRSRGPAPLIIGGGYRPTEFLQTIPRCVAWPTRTRLGR